VDVEREHVNRRTTGSAAAIASSSMVTGCSGSAVGIVVARIEAVTGGFADDLATTSVRSSELELNQDDSRNALTWIRGRLTTCADAKNKE
jgi:hypothetical protein